jgi:tetratricopeptide (TPR) repeat protein
MRGYMRIELRQLIVFSRDLGRNSPAAACHAFTPSGRLASRRIRRVPSPFLGPGKAAWALKSALAKSRPYPPGRVSQACVEWCPQIRPRSLKPSRHCCTVNPCRVLFGQGFLACGLTERKKYLRPKGIRGPNVLVYFKSLSQPGKHPAAALIAAGAGWALGALSSRFARFLRGSRPPGLSHDASSLNEAAWADQKASCNEGAIALFAQALALNPRCAEALRGRGLCYSEMGEYDLAMQDFHAWVLCAPESGEAYFHRAKVWRTLGFIDLAISDFRSSLRFSASNTAAREAVEELARAHFGDGLETNPAATSEAGTNAPPPCGSEHNGSVTAAGG